MVAVCLFEQTGTLFVLDLHLDLHHFLDKGLILADRNSCPRSRTVLLSCEEGKQIDTGMETRILCYINLLYVEKGQESLLPLFTSEMNFRIIIAFC